MPGKVSLKRIDRVLAMLALIIEETGDERYWPVFDRLERERAFMADRSERLARAKKRSQTISDQTSTRSY